MNRRSRLKGHEISTPANEKCDEDCIRISIRISNLVSLYRSRFGMSTAPFFVVHQIGLTASSLVAGLDSMHDDDKIQNITKHIETLELALEDLQEIFSPAANILSVLRMQLKSHQTRKGNHHDPISMKGVRDTQQLQSPTLSAVDADAWLADLWSTDASNLDNEHVNAGNQYINHDNALENRDISMDDGSNDALGHFGLNDIEEDIEEDSWVEMFEELGAVAQKQELSRVNPDDYGNIVGFMFNRRHGNSPK